MTAMCETDAIRSSIFWLRSLHNPSVMRAIVDSLKKSHVLHQWAKIHNLNLESDSDIERLRPFQEFLKNECDIKLNDSDLIYLLRDLQGLIGRKIA